MNPKNQCDCCKYKCERKHVKNYPCQFILLTILLVPIAAYFFLTGLVNAENCKCAPKLPFWMMVIGLVLLYERINAVRCESEREYHLSCSQTFCDIQTNPISKGTFKGFVLACIVGIFFIYQLYTTENWLQECNPNVSVPSILFIITFLFISACGFVVMVIRACFGIYSCDYCDNKHKHEEKKKPLVAV